MIKYIKNIFDKINKISFDYNMLNKNFKVFGNNNKKLKLNNSDSDNEDLFDYKNFKNNEKNVHISEIINKNNYFKFEFKKYFSDFIVHEISTNGDIIELNSIDINNCILSFEKKKDEFDFENNLDDIDKNRIKLFNENKTNDESIDIDVTNLDKNKRKAIHFFVNNNFNNLCTFTLDINENNLNKKIIKIKKHGSKEEKKNYKKQRKGRNEDFYLYFNLYHENRGTIQAVLDITKILNIKPKNISYAGTKDKRSISTQQCCIYNTKVERLLEYNKKVSNYKFPIILGNFSYKKDKLCLGQLAGNRFDLVLRNVEINSIEIFEKTIQNIKENGFINYFGLQRFGYSFNSTFKIGILILRKSYFEAVNLILSYRKKDLLPFNEKYTKSFNECIKIYKEQNDAKTAYEEFYWKNFNEGWLLKGLSLYENNYINAFNLIPRNSRLLYCHAYQSYIWNRIATFRFKTYGLNLTLGDLVTLKKNIQNGKLVNNFKYLNKNSNHSECENLEGDEEIEEVVIIDESNINKFTIYDVVLPIVGSKIRLPQNLIKDELIQALDEDGISLETFMNSNVKFFLTGKYRRFLTKPVDLNYEILKDHSMKFKRFFNTDLEKLNINLIKNEDESEQKSDIEIDESMNYLVKLSFSLSSSSYATMFLRELSGVD